MSSTAEHVELESLSDDGRHALERSKSTAVILQALKDEESDIVDTITSAFMGSRKLAFMMFGILFMTSVCIVSLTGATVYLIKDTSSNEGVLADKSSGEALATASTFSVDSDLTSESPLEEFAEVMRVNMLFGDEQTGSFLSLIPTGFVRASCNATYVTCTSDNTVYMFTPEGTILYHGSDTYLVDASERLKTLLGIHHPSIHAASKALQESPHHVHLTAWGWWWISRIVWRWVRKWVYKRGKGWVREWAYEAVFSDDD